LEELPTEIQITDLNGINANNIKAAGNDSWLPGLALSYNGKSWEVIDGIDYNHISLRSVYMRNEKETYFSGSGIITYFGDRITHINDLTTGSLYKIRGSKKSSDIFSVGYEEILHYNGRDWKSFNSEIIMSGKDFYGVYLTEETVFIVGINYNNFNAIILIGRR
jgi:hypothetical protein